MPPTQSCAAIVDRAGLLAVSGRIATRHRNWQAGVALTIPALRQQPALDRQPSGDDREDDEEALHAGRPAYIV